MPSLNRRVPCSPLVRQIKFTLAGVATAAVLFGSTPGALAGTAEVTALQLALGKPLFLATSAELLAAYNTVVANPKFNTAAKRGVVAGEALKAAGPNATDAGTVFGTNLVAGVLVADRDDFVAATAKTAGTGAGLNVTQIPELSRLFFTLDSDALAAANLATGNAAKGAILGGRARELLNDAAKTAFANNALTNAKLKAAVQDIARYVGDEVVNSSSFAVNIARANIASTLKIAPGVAAADPGNAGAITNALLSDSNPVGTTSVGATARTGAAALATSVAAVADIEEIAKIANAISVRIAANDSVKPIKLSAAAGITTSLAKAILAKPTAATGANKIANKQDELAELAAYMIGGFSGSNNPDLKKKASTTATTIVNIIKAAASAGLIKDKINPTTGAAYTAAELAAIQLETARNIVASAALTIQLATWGTDLTGADIKTAITNLLKVQDSKGVYTTIAGIAGIGKINATAAPGVIPLAVQSVLDAVNGVNTGRFENGLVANISDPETDSRPL